MAVAEASEAEYEKWENIVINVGSSSSETRLESYQMLINAFKQGLLIRKLFHRKLGEYVIKENFKYLRPLLKLVEEYVTFHREILMKDYIFFPLFQGVVYKYNTRHLSSCLNVMYLNHTIVHFVNTFPNDFLFIITIRLFSQPAQKIPSKVVEMGLYVAQAVEVTGEVMPLITVLTPFEILRAACITLMEIRETYKSSPTCDVYQWTENTLVALWYLNRPEMMSIFQSLPGNLQKAVILMIKNYGKYEGISLEPELPDVADIIDEEENYAESKCDTCDWSTRTVIDRGTSLTDLSVEMAENAKKNKESKCDICSPDIASPDNLDKDVMEKHSTEEVDATKSITSMLIGNKPSAKESIFKLLKHPSTLPASNEDLSKLASQLKLREMQEKVKLVSSEYTMSDSTSELPEQISEGQKQEESSDSKSQFYAEQEVFSWSNTDWESIDDDDDIYELFPEAQAEIIKAMKLDTDLTKPTESELSYIRDEGLEDEPEEGKYESGTPEDEPEEENYNITFGDYLEEVNYDTSLSGYSQIDAELTEGISEGRLKRKRRIQRKEPKVKQKKIKRELPEVPVHWEESAKCVPSVVVTASKTASTSKLMSLKKVPSKITSLFKGRRSQSQTTVPKEKVEGPDSTSNSKKYAEAWKILKVEVESLNNEIYNCKIEINATEFEIEQLRHKIRCNNILIQNREKKMKERFSEANF